MKTLATAAALAALLASPAFAQDSTTDEPPAAMENQAPDMNTPKDPNAAATTEDSLNSDSAITNDSAATDSATSGMAQGEKFLTQQDNKQMLGSKIIGATIYSSGNENLGSVSDLVINRETGEIQAAIVGVGGFLGIGTKDVAVSFKQIEQSTDADGNEKLVLNATKEELDAAPEFVWLSDRDAVLDGQNAPADPSVTTPSDPLAPADPMAPAEPAPAQ